MQPSEFNYEEVGFDAFLIRPLPSSPLPSASNLPRLLNLDQIQLSGGSKVKLGRVLIDGDNGRISYLDSQGVEQAFSGLPAPTTNTSSLQ